MHLYIHRVHNTPCHPYSFTISDEDACKVHDIRSTLVWKLGSAKKINKTWALDLTEDSISCPSRPVILSDFIVQLIASIFKC